MQWLAECRYIQDITHLSKEPDNRDQNIIDPYNVFLYPLDFFVSGSEYATFLIGNASSPAANIQPQNYLLFKANLTYGLTDNFNLGIGGGYRSNSSLQHFSLPDLRRHSLEFKPYYFIDSLCDWRLTKNSLLSVKAHVVPDYTTIDDRTGDPKEYESKNNYFDIVISLKFLV